MEPCRLRYRLAARALSLTALVLVGVSSHALSDAPLSPVIGVEPPTLDFGEIPIGTCNDLLARLFNNVSDPTSSLEITDIDLTGAEVTIIDAPSLPVIIPGDGASAIVMLRVCPIDPGVRQGVFTVTGRAVNSPHNTSHVSTGIEVAHASRYFFIDFESGAIIPPPIPDGPLSCFTFTVDGLRERLEGAGVVRLEKLLPSFTSEDVHGENFLGEEILLHDMSWAYIAHVSELHAVVDAISELRERPGIRILTPDFTVVPHSTLPNDELFDWDGDMERGDQWGLHNDADIWNSHTQGTMVADVDINAPEAWDLNPGSAEVRVAVLDTGVDLDHPDLVRHMATGHNTIEVAVPPEDQDPTSHGTAVAGIIGATGNSVEGLAGTSWGPTLVPVRCIDTTNPDEIYIRGVIQGIDWAREQGIPIANASFGSSRPHPGTGTDFMSYAIGNAARAGMFVVASMGNDNGNFPAFPAAFGWSSFAVGALWFNGHRWQDSGIPGLEGSTEGSNYGNWIDVCAPGGAAIVTTKRNGDYYNNHADNLFTPIGQMNGFRGSSPAAAFASGVAALLKSVNEELIGDDFGNIMIATADDVDVEGFGWDVYTGQGLIRADKAMKFIAPLRLYPPPEYGYGPRRVEHLQMANLEVYEVLQNQTHTFIDVPDIPSGTYHNVTRYELRGDAVYSTPFQQGFLASWWRTSGTIGWPPYPTTVYEVAPLAWAEVIDNIHSYHEYRTYVFYVPNYGYFPPVAGPEGARIAVTYVGNVSEVGIQEEPFPGGHVTASVFPNPALGHAQFVITGPGNTTATLRIYNLSGRLVATVADGMVVSRRSEVGWDCTDGRGRRVGQGVYFWRLEVDGEEVRTDKVVIGSY